MPRNPNSPHSGCGPVHTHVSASENIKLQMMMAKLEDSLKDEFVLKEQLKTINLESLLGGGNVDIKSIDRIEKASEGLIDTYTIYFINNTEPYSFSVTNGRDGANGADGSDGQDGTDGREIELKVTEAYIQWHYTGEDSWTNLIALSSLKGADGRNGIDGTDGKDGTNGTDGKDGKDGINGREIELNVDHSSKYIQWRLKGDAAWTNLLSLEALIGATGKDGADGKDGISPVLRILNNIWEVSYDNGLTFTSTGIAATGPAGKDGANGLDGKDGSQGPAGTPGRDGANGKDGVGIADIKHDRNDPNGNCIYVITLTDGRTEEFTVYKGADGAQGEKGDQGEQGLQGEKGKSAYEIAVENGYQYDAATWLSSLKGTDGKDGVNGAPGIDGKDGADGENGKDGKSAYQSWLDIGNTGTEQDFIQSLKGKNGTDGTNGTDGEDGKSAYQSWLDIGNEGTEQDFIQSLRGSRGEDGQNGKDGQDGKDGDTVEILSGEWYINGEATGVKAEGLDGRSAYEIACDYEPFSTERDWLNSLKGKDGTNGTNGESAYEIAIRRGTFDGSEGEWLESLNGTDGRNGVDGLTPYIGSDGNWIIGDDNTGIKAKGENGAAGKSAYDIACDNGFDGDEEEWIKSLKGKDGKDAQPTSIQLNTQIFTQDTEGLVNITTGVETMIAEYHATKLSEELPEVLPSVLPDIIPTVLPDNATLADLQIGEDFTTDITVGHLPAGFEVKATMTFGELIKRMLRHPSNFCDHIWVEADCTTPKTCSICGKTEGEALGHVEETIEGKAATCTETGLTNGVKCSRCGIVLSAQQSIPATGHTWSTWTRTLEPTCDTKGQDTRTCTVCGVVETREVAALGHNYTSTVTKDATCTETGIKTYTCVNDPTHTYTESIAALGHNYTSKITTAAGCETTGVRTYTCSRCGDSYTEIIPATGHKAATAVRENEVAAQCEVAGSYESVVYCSVCNTELSRETKTIAALGHAYGDWVITKTPEIEIPGEQQKTCARCGHVVTEEIPALPKPETPESTVYYLGGIGNDTQQDCPAWWEDYGFDIPARTAYYFDHLKTNDVRNYEEGKLEGQHELSWTLSIPLGYDADMSDAMGEDVVFSDSDQVYPAIAIPSDYKVDLWSMDAENSYPVADVIDEVETADGYTIYYVQNAFPYGATKTFYITISKK